MRVKNSLAEKIGTALIVGAGAFGIGGCEKKQEVTLAQIDSCYVDALIHTSLNPITITEGANYKKALESVRRGDSLSRVYNSQNCPDCPDYNLRDNFAIIASLSCVYSDLLYYRGEGNDPKKAKADYEYLTHVLDMHPELSSDPLLIGLERDLVNLSVEMR